MTTQSDYQNYHRLKAKLEKEIADTQKPVSQEMSDNVWKDEERRLDWVKQDKAQWNYNTSRLARMKRLYNKCFPQKEWIIAEVEAFYRAEEGSLY